MNHVVTRIDGKRKQARDYLGLVGVRLIGVGNVLWIPQDAQTRVVRTFRLLEYTFTIEQTEQSAYCELVPNCGLDNVCRQGPMVSPLPTSFAPSPNLLPPAIEDVVPYISMALSFRNALSLVSLNCTFLLNCNVIHLRPSSSSPFHSFIPSTSPVVHLTLHLLLPQYTQHLFIPPPISSQRTTEVALQDTRGGAS